MTISRRDFWAKLFGIADKGTTILVSTHYMDEAERCHRLAILDKGSKVADGKPDVLQSSTGMSVVEVLADNPHEAQLALRQHRDIVSVTQLGIRLRILIPTRHDEPLKLVQACLRDKDVAAEVHLIPASLEDVFVASTRASGDRE